MAELTGQTFAGYEIIAKLGQGGMGAVYKARQTVLKRLAALKVVAPQLAQDKEFIARFKREAALAAQLNHPNVVQVYSAGETDGTHYMAMEFVEGETLREHIASRGRLDAPEAIAITVYVAEALKYAWNKSKLVHRDIKPDNVFLSTAGEVKVGDLGLAKTVGQTTVGMTATGMMMGSPHYISPEQASARKDIDFRADIYSLGCTLFQMLTGRTPYEGDDPMAVMNLHVNAPPPAIFKVWPQCPMPLGLLVGKMLKKKPHERHGSYEELIAELTAVHEKLAAAQTAAAAPPSGTITFLFTDIEGSTRLWEQHPQAMPIALERHNQILRRTMESHGGFVFKTVGDAFCVAFASAPNALAAALATQRALVTEPWGATGPLRVRMALHTGAAESRGGDYFGPTLNRVARVLGAAHGGQVLLSNATEQLVRDHLMEGASLSDLGERSLKNLARTERIFQLNLADQPTQFPTLRSVAKHPPSHRRQQVMLYAGAGAAVVVLLAGLFLWSPWKSRTDEQGRREDAKTGSESRLQAESAAGKPAKAGTPNAEAAPRDDYAALAKRVRAARTATGPVIRCSPNGDNGMLAYADALKQLKPGMILQMQAGEYPEDPITTDNVILEMERGIKGKIRISSKGCVIRKASGAPVSVGQKSMDTDLLVVDSRVNLWTLSGSEVICFNSAVSSYSFAGGSRARFQNCTFRLRDHPFVTMIIGDCKSLRLDDCIIWGESKAAFAISRRNPDTVRIECNRCLLPSRLAMHVDSTSKEITPLETTPDPALFKIAACVTQDKGAIKNVFHSDVPGFLADDSPAKGIALGGRDPGVKFDEEGNILPLEPFVPDSAKLVPLTETRVTALTTNPKVGEVFTLEVGKGATMELMGIPPGEFMMGTSKEELDWAIENGLSSLFVDQQGGPPSKVAIAQGFWMGRTEVTVGQWKQFVGETSYLTDGEKKGESWVWLPQKSGNPYAMVKGKNWRDPNFGFEPQANHPVCCISWNDATAYCAWLTTRARKDGRLPASMVIRLPTEAEWEYACRAGTQTKFWWGDSKEKGYGRLNWVGNTDGFEFVAPVDSFGAKGRNSFGLADMLGNLWEWCSDKYVSPQAGESARASNPAKCAIRGGCYRDPGASSRCASRLEETRSRSNGNNGFRIVVGLSPEAPVASVSSATASRGVDDAFMREVAALPAEEQVQRVVAKLKELNPGFDGKVKHRIKDGAVIELEFSSIAVADIGPVRALKKLGKLTCCGEEKGKSGLLADLSPLRGLPLKELRVSYNSFSDLAPLQGMSLKTFECSGTQVSDLSPLAGMSLGKLGIKRTKVADLSVVNGMPLHMLECQDTGISDLSALQGCPLTLLYCSNMKVRDLSPLKGMQLKDLYIVGTEVSDVSVLRGMPLDRLCCTRTMIKDLSPLAESPLKELDCDFNTARNSTILRSIKTLETINKLPAAEFWKRVDAGQSLQAK